MKIVYARTQFWFGQNVGGSFSHTLGVIDGFKKEKCDMIVLTNVPLGDIDEIKCYVIEPRVKQRIVELFYNLYAEAKFGRIISKFKPDFIYHRRTNYTYFITKIAKKLRIPVILELNGFGLQKFQKKKKKANRLKNFIERYVLYNIVKSINYYNIKNASLIISVGHDFESTLLKMGVKKRNIVYNQMGVDVDNFNPDLSKGEKCKEIKNKLGIDDSKTTVAFAGTFEEWHGIRQLTEVIEIIFKENLLSNVCFLMIGDGRLKAETERGLSSIEEVKFVGAVPHSEVPYYLSACDILLAPYIFIEGSEDFFASPAKIPEYIAVAKGVIASDIPQVREILEDNKTALLVRPGNTDDLLRGILRLYRDKNLRERLGREARKEVVRNYTWTKHVDKILNCFEKEVCITS